MANTLTKPIDAPRLNQFSLHSLVLSLVSRAPCIMEIVFFSLSLLLSFSDALSLSSSSSFRSILLESSSSSSESPLSLVILLFFLCYSTLENKEIAWGDVKDGGGQEKSSLSAPWQWRFRSFRIILCHMQVRSLLFLDFNSFSLYSSSVSALFILFVTLPKETLSGKKIYLLPSILPIRYILWVFTAFLFSVPLPW